MRHWNERKSSEVLYNKAELLATREAINEREKQCDNDTKRAEIFDNKASYK